MTAECTLSAFVATIRENPVDRSATWSPFRAFVFGRQGRSHVKAWPLAVPRKPDAHMNTPHTRSLMAEVINSWDGVWNNSMSNLQIDPASSPIYSLEPGYLPGECGCNKIATGTGHQCQQRRHKDIVVKQVTALGIRSRSPIASNFNDHGPTTRMKISRDRVTTLSMTNEWLTPCSRCDDSESRTTIKWWVTPRTRLRKM